MRMKLSVLLSELIIFPELYIGKPSVERLYAFLSGYLFQNECANDHCLDGFTEYIADIYGIKSDHNWASIIEFFSNTEEEAFKTFISHYNSFTSQRNRE